MGEYVIGYIHDPPHVETLGGYALEHTCAKLRAEFCFPYIYGNPAEWGRKAKRINGLLESDRECREGALRMARVLARRILTVPRLVERCGKVVL